MKRTDVYVRFMLRWRIVGLYDRCRGRAVLIGMLGRTDSSGHLPFQIACGEEPDTSEVGLCDVDTQRAARTVFARTVVMKELMKFNSYKYNH